MSFFVKPSKVINSEKYHKKVVYSISFLGEDILSCAGDGMIIKHEAGMKTAANFDIEFNGKFSALATSHDGKYLSVGLDSGRIQLLAGTDFSVLDDTSELHIKYVTTMKFSRDNAFFASASNNGTCVISQPPQLNIYRRLAGHCERIADLDFNLDATQLVTASFDGTAQLSLKII